MGDDRVRTDVRPKRAVWSGSAQNVRPAADHERGSGDFALFYRDAYPGAVRLAWLLVTFRDAPGNQGYRLPDPPFHHQEVAQATGVEERFALGDAATHSHCCEVGASSVF